MNNTYYLSANTSNGYISFFDSSIESFKKIIILKNASKQAREKLFLDLIPILDYKNICYDKIIRSGTADETDAVIINQLSTVIADEGLFSKEFPLYADVINFAEHLRYDFEVQNEIANVKNKIEILNKRMYRHLNQAKIIHDEWEKIYISNMDFDKLDSSCRDLIDNMFAGITKKENTYQNSDRFLGSLLPRGSINYIEDLTNNLNKRIYIKGRPGTGKSTLLKKIVSKAKEYNLNTETYYCSFDSKSLDMVIIRDLGLAIFDSTSPHEVFPGRSCDEIFDIYEIAVNNDTDLNFSDELLQISGQYNHEIKKAKECLYTCNAYRRRLDSIIYDETVVSNCVQRIIALSSLN
ncbi:MAG: hypothetical protein IKJ68_01145 [Clostridia bacterium]|nr:hypothetical protein [Clostridia bacterium]